MGGIIFLILVFIVGVGIWLYLRSSHKSSGNSQQPLIKIPCKDGYIMGYYLGSRFLDNALSITDWPRKGYL